MNFPVVLQNLLFLSFLSPILQADETGKRDIAEIRPLLETYCFDCHGEKKQKGDLRLDTYLTGLDVLKDRKVWLSVLEQLETREMPPKDPLPSEKEYETLIDWVDEAGNQINWDAIKHPGHVTLPRLTRREYNNTIRDLFGLDSQPGRIFSPDGEGKSGFTNDRDNLFFTASEMEKYFTPPPRSPSTHWHQFNRSRKRRFSKRKICLSPRAEPKPILSRTGARDSP